MQQAHTTTANTSALIASTWARCGVATNVPRDQAAGVLAGHGRHAEKIQAASAALAAALLDPIL